MGIVGHGGGGILAAGMSGRPCGEEGGDWILENGSGLARLGKRSKEEAVSVTGSGSEVGKRSEGMGKQWLGSACLVCAQTPPPGGETVARVSLLGVCTTTSSI